MSLNFTQFLQFLRFYESILTVKVVFHAGVNNVRAEIIGRLSEVLNIPPQCNEDECDVSVVFCPIVSRAGTDIEAILRRLRADKPTIVFVLHHTFSPEYSVPDSSKYERNNLMMVDILFYEDQGLLNCSKNNEAITKAENYLKRYAKHQYKVNIKRILCTFGIGIGIVVGCHHLKFI